MVESEFNVNLNKIIFCKDFLTIFKAPEPEVLFKVYIFEVTNPEEFLDGTDDVLKVKQVGPVVYREWLRHENVVFHEHNNSMTYTVIRTLEYKDEMNEPGMLNRSILVPNMGEIYLF